MRDTDGTRHASEAAWDDIEQDQYEQDHENQPQAPGGGVPPLAAVAPCGQSADEQKHQDDEQDESHAFLLLNHKAPRYSQKSDAMCKGDRSGTNLRRCSGYFPHRVEDHGRRALQARWTTGRHRLRGERCLAGRGA